MTKLTRLCSSIFEIALLAAAIQGGNTALSSSIKIVPKSFGWESRLPVRGTQTGGLRSKGRQLIDQTPELHARKQPAVPENYKEIPFGETAPPPEFTVEETERGYLLFQRPIMEPVYPNTQPLEHERLERLVAFATPGEFEPLTFSLYPARNLKNLRVRCSSLACDAGEIPASQITVRLATYWNIGYPRYTSRDTYRRTPELLERVTVHTSPAHECQRYWIVVHVPADAKPGLYRGKVTVWDDGFDKAVQIPVAFRVLGFPLKKDPAKHYSVYYYVRNRTQYKDKPDEFVQKASQNEYQAMLDYGMDVAPTQYLQCLDGKTFTIRNPEDLDRLVQMGFKGPVPVTGGNAIGRIYRDTTPGGERGSHWRINKMPPPEFYAKVTELFKAFEAARKARGWPEFVCCPLDEVASTHSEFGAKVYAAVRAAGIRTYITKNPIASDAAAYLPHIDVWCSQPYSMPYEKIIAQERYEYWSYPNHNAGEIKDRRVMCKGGRMTYGFGFWRSGYTTLVPWHWSWTPGDDQFDYLRGSRSGCGQRLTDDGEVIPSIYWECFREGYDDARYLYTLQQAIFQCESSRNPECRRAVEDAKELLQAMWDSINVQQKYLAEGMWPSEEFNARRWLLAKAIEQLDQYPAEQQDIAPSVLVTKTAPQPKRKDETPLIEKALQTGNIEIKDLSGGFTSWSSGTKEGTVHVTEEAGRQGQKGLRWHILVDHKTDGGEGGKYPVGWPRISRTFGQGELDMSDYDYLSFVVRVDSDRDEVADDFTLLGFLLASHKVTQRFFETRRDLGGRQRVWISVHFSIKDLVDKVGLGVDPWSDISRVQLFISENDYAHNTNLTFDVAEAKLLRFKSPVISQLTVPEYLLLPRTRLPISFEVMGTNSANPNRRLRLTVKPGSHRVVASLTTSEGQVIAEQKQDLFWVGKSGFSEGKERHLAGQRVVVLDTSSISPGHYQLQLTIADAEGNLCSEETRYMEAIPGPDYDTR